MLGLSAVLVLLCVWRVRRVALAEISGDTPQARRRARRAARTSAASEAEPGRVRRVFGPPMVWKELQTRFTRSRLRVLVVAAFSLGVLGLTYAASAQSLDQHSVHAFYVMILLFLGLLVTTVVGATGISTEKEAGTWEPLLGTSLSAWDIVVGKAVGAAGRSLPIWLLLGFHLILFMGLGTIKPIVLVHVAMVVAGVVTMLTGTGLFFSVCFKRTTFAVAVALGLAIFIWALLPISIVMFDFVTFGGNGARDFSELYWTAHPMFQAFLVTDGASGDQARQPLALLEYNWPMRFSSASGHGLGVTGTTMIVLLTMLGNMGIGGAFAGLTMYLVRRTQR
jgi:ABC-type transport system involved in multi-copper enzyme maturation permease subunit